MKGMVSLPHRQNALEPIMTFYVAKTHIAFPVSKLEKVLTVRELVPLPLAPPQHLGVFFEHRDLIPVLRIDPPTPSKNACESWPHLPYSLRSILVLRISVRSRPLAIAIDATGKTCHDYGLISKSKAKQLGLNDVPSSCGTPHRAAVGAHLKPSWVLDPDRMFLDSPLTDPSAFCAQSA